MESCSVMRLMMFSLYTKCNVVYLVIVINVCLRTRQIGRSEINDNIVQLPSD